MLPVSCDNKEGGFLFWDNNSETRQQGTNETVGLTSSSGSKGDDGAAHEAPTKQIKSQATQV
jgi:hypothetical protein